MMAALEFILFLNGHTEVLHGLVSDQIDGVVFDYPDLHARIPLERKKMASTLESLNVVPETLKDVLTNRRIIQSSRKPL